MKICLLITAILFTAACSRPPSAADRIGKASVALTSVPSDVACLQINVNDEPHLFDVAASSSSVFEMNDLPVGTDTFAASTFATSCALVTPTSTASWSSPAAVTADVSATNVVPVTLSLEHNGQASIGVDFPADDAGVAYLFHDSSPATMRSYLLAVANRYCSALGACCSQSGATSWDETACELAAGPDSPYAHSGIGNINSSATYLESGHVLLDPAHAQNCLASFDRYTCGEMTPHEFTTRAYECAQSLYGSLPAGSSCTSTFECAGDAWCNRYYANGYDTCMPILGIGSQCGTDSSNYACQTHGYGSQAQACDWDVHHATGTQTCQPLLPIGAADGYPSQCQTGLASGGVCVSQYPGFLPSTCAAFAAQ